LQPCKKARPDQGPQGKNEVHLLAEGRGGEEARFMTKPLEGYTNPLTLRGGKGEKRFVEFDELQRGGEECLKRFPR